MRRNSGMDGLRSSSMFIQESMSENLLETISSEEIEFERVKAMPTGRPVASLKRARGHR